MNFHTFAQYFAQLLNKQPRRKKPSRPVKKLSRRAHLLLETLEDRAVPAINTTPTVFSVTPTDGSAVNTDTPLLQVVFSEEMQFDNGADTGASNPSNYLLIDSSGNQFSIDDVLAVNSTINGELRTTVTLSYNGGSPLIVDTYTLFVHGDRLIDVDDNRPMAPAAQLVVANAGTNDLEIINLLADGTLSAVSQYPMPFDQTTAPNPNAILFRDLNGDNRSDMIVANSTTNQLAIFLGRGAADGFGFNLTPDRSLNLPVGTANSPRSIAIGDFNNDMELDIAVANSTTNDISVFLKIQGTFDYNAAVNYAAGTSPRAIVATDLNGDNIIDLAVANNTISGVNYTVSFLRGIGDGTFAVPTNVIIGVNDTTNNVVNGVHNPTDLAFGNFDSDSNPDLVVAGSNGVRILNNTSTPTALSFTAGTIITTTATPSLTAGRYDSDMTDDVVTVTANGIEVFRHNGTGTFTPSTVFGTSIGTADIELRDLNNDGTPEVLVVNSATPSTVSVLNQTNMAGLLAQVTGSPFSVGQGAVDVALGDVNGDGFLDFATANPTANNVTVYFGNGDLTFRQSQQIPVTPTTTRAVAVGDLNRDGIPDIVVVNNNGSTSSSRVTVALGMAGGGYSAPLDYAVAATGRTLRELTGVAIGDMNLDGRPDIVVIGRGSGGGFGTSEYRVGFISNNITTIGGGLTPTSFTAVQDIGIGDQPTQIVLADFNNDNRLDIAVSHDRGGGFGNSSRRGVSIRLNTSSGGGNFSFSNTQEFASGTFASSLVVADFNNDGNLDFIATDSQSGRAVVRYGTGNGNFTNGGSFDLGINNPASIAAADFNADGFQDIVVASNSNSLTAGGVSVLLNQLGTGFGTPIQTNVLPGTELRNVVTTDLNRDGKTDILVSTASSMTGTTFANVIALYGIGDGTFRGDVPYLGGQPNDIASTPNSYLALTSNPLIRATTFRSGGTSVFPNLILNGDFELRDLNSEQGNLVGWEIYRDPSNPGGSHGQWLVQTGSDSPLSGETVPLPAGRYRAMLDQADLIPQPPGFGMGPPPPNPNPDSSYEGTHALYQDIFIPAGATRVTLSLSLYLQNFSNAWSDTNTTTSLDFRLAAENQQVRVDIMDPNGQILGVTTATGVLRNLFTTNAGDQLTRTLTITDDDLTEFAGQTIRLRIASANNDGKLIVGVDNVQLRALFPDSLGPTLSGVHLPNPGVLVDGLNHTTDPTIAGTVSDNGTVNNVSFIEFDPLNDGFGPGQDADNFKVTAIDADGNFSFTLPQLTFGPQTIGVRAVDNAGNTTDTTISFFYQGSSPLVWQAYGPDATSTTGQGVDYRDVTGRITSIAVDPTDLSGNTYFVGSANGGIWKTTDGGKSWTPLTDNLTDSSGNPIPAPIGAVAISKTNPQILYAGMGVADNQFNSRAGSGVLKSTDGGQTWFIVGNSNTVLAGARISKIVIDNNDPNIVYAAVASGGASGPGVYKSIDGGQTWANVLLPTQMFLANTANGGPTNNTLAAGTALASVTDLVIDPFNSNRLLVGLGNIGLVGSNATAGVWVSVNKGNSWRQVLGGDTTGAAGQLPSGTGVGRITIAMGNGRPGDEAITYYLIGTPPASVAPPTVNNGGFNGLYTSRDNLLNFTQVMLRQNTAGPGALPVFADIDLLGVDGAYAGALAVDPANPNVVYVGGSRRFDLADPLTHSFIRVDTGNMILAGGAREGDDATKNAQGAFYDPPTNSVAYTGEGVFWYSLEQDQSNEPGNNRLLPPTIHALAFDPLGRLLVGTEGGIWRGSNYGFKYDFTSGGEGIVRGQAPDMNGMDFVSLNNNLQITDLTSVAIDPTDPTLLYTTQVSLGASGSLGLLDWLSQGLTGPNIGGSSLGIPTAGSIVVSSPIPGSPPDSPTVLFRVWQYANGQALRPEVSQDNGATWNALASTGIGSGQNAAMFPAFVINPNPIFDSGLFQNELLFGTDKVFLTRTSSTIWDPISGTLSSSGGLITALAVPPSKAGAVLAASNTSPVQITSTNHGLQTGQQINISGVTGNIGANGTFTVTRIDKDNFTLNGSIGTGTYTGGGFWSTVTGIYYAGTNLGEIFVTQNTGADGWPLRNAGLPSAQVNEIVVDPNNALTAYALFDGVGGPGHVWRTTDGGVTWTNISANLPNVPAYDLVVDPTVTIPAPNGKLFVATDAGVYVSLDNAVSWQRLGQGLPNAPVVDLQYDAAHGILAAASQGRGAFTIQVDNIGPRVVAISNTLTENAVTITFSESINVSTFTTADITLTGPAGNVAVTAIQDVDPVLHNTFKIFFSSGVARGAYTIIIGPNVNDLVGNPMDQDQDGLQGESLQDRYSGRFIFQAQGNSAPVLGNTNPNLPTILEDIPAASNIGISVAQFISGLTITDPDSNNLRGIAVFNLDNTNGTWQYSQDSGATWTDFGTVTESQARLLENLSRNRIRFVPSDDFFGTATFKYRAWDLTSDLSSFNGTDGGTGDATQNGGSFAYSSDMGTATINVTGVNDAPSFNKGANQTVPENAGTQTVPNWATAISAGPNETGQTLTFTVTNNNNALFEVQPSIDANGTLTYKSALNANGVATVTVILKDNGGTANGGQDTSAAQTFTITIQPVNSPPTFDIPVTHLNVLPGSGQQTRTNWVTNISPGAANELGQTLTFLVTNNNNGLFTQQPTIDGNGTLRFTPTATAHGTATVTVVLKDNGGTAFGGNDTSDPKTFTITVNTPPNFAALPDRTLNHLNSLTFALDPFLTPTGMDPDGDALSFSVSVSGYGPYELDQELGLYRATSDYSFNSLGYNEKWVRALNDNNAWYYILENGELYKWNGSTDLFSTATLQLKKANLDASVWTDPALLHNAYFNETTQQFGTPPAPIPLTASIGAAAPHNLTINNPPGNFAGVARITVSVTDSFNGTPLDTVSRSFLLTVTNNKPQLDPIPTQTMSHTSPGLTIDLDAFNPFDADGEAITFPSVMVEGYSQLYELEQQYRFFQNKNTYYPNAVFAGSKWILSAVNKQWYFILQNGNLHRWTGGSVLANSPVIATLDPSVWANPSLLHDAQPPVNPLTTNPDAVTVTSVNAGNEFTINTDGDFTGSVKITVRATDGVETVNNSFKLEVTNTPPQLLPFSNVSIRHNQVYQQDLNLFGFDADFDPLTYGAMVTNHSQELYNLDQSLGFPATVSDYITNWGGQNEKWILAANKTWYFILPTGELRRWTGGAQNAILTNSVSVAFLHPDVWTTPSLLHNAQQPPNVPAPVVNLASNNVLTIDPNDAFVGYLKVKIDLTDNFSTTSQTFFINVTNDAPVINSITSVSPSQPAPPFVMNHNQDTITINVNATDGDNDTLTYNAVVTGYSRLYELDQQLGFPAVITNYVQNWGGQNEKWLLAANNTWYFLVPNMATATTQLRQWLGGPQNAILANSIAVPDGTFDITVWETPSLLHNAQPPASPSVGVTKIGNQFTFDPPNTFAGTFQVTVSVSDGIATTSQTFKITHPNANPEFSNPTNDPNHINNITDISLHHLATTVVNINATDADNDAITYGAEVIPFATLNKNLRFTGEFYLSYGGANAKWLLGDDGWYFIRPNGEFVKWNGVANQAAGTVIAQLPVSVYFDPRPLYQANPVNPPATTTINGTNVTINPNDNFVGLFQVKFTAGDAYFTKEKTIWVVVTNEPVTLGAISNQSMFANSTLNVPLAVGNPDNDPLNFNVTIQGFSLAYELDQQYGFFLDPSGLHFDFHGQDEKWIRAADGRWYAIKPNGELWLLGNTNVAGGANAFAQLIAVLGTEFWTTPSLLYNATLPSAPSVSWQINGGFLELTPASGFTGTFRVIVSVSDGPSTATRSFLVSVS